MNWLKHNGNASFDSRIVALREALGYFGIGVYWTMVEQIECWGDGVFPRKKLLDDLSGRKADRRRLQQVLDDFGLFVTLESGLVMVQKGQPTRKPTPRPTPKPTPQPQGKNAPQVADSSATQGARVSIIEIEKDNNYNNTDNTLPLTQEPITLPLTQQPKTPPLTKRGCHEVTGALEDYTTQMKQDQGEWHETVCMKSGYSALLHKYWSEAVDQWRQHVICYDTAHQIADYSRARYYFNSFIKLHSKSGDALKATLEALEAKATQVIEDNEALPPNAPPRPSPTAIWNPASESWSEFY